MNFDYLKDNVDFASLYANCVTAESMYKTNPNISVTFAGMANEYVVKFLYESAYGYTSKTVYDILTDWQFKKMVGYNQNLLDHFHSIRKIRNSVQHSGKVCNESESLNTLEELVYVVGYFFMSLGVLTGMPSFVEPGEEVTPPVVEPPVPPVGETTPEEPVVAKYAEKLRKIIFSTKAGRSEEENKKKFFTSSLTEADWPIVSKDNVALPSSVGVNMLLASGDTCDYIMYSASLKPLAVVKYASATESLPSVKDKIIDIAKQFTLKLGYTPVAYYTDGYTIMVYDHLTKEPRRVFNFHSISELEMLVQRQSTRKDISSPVIDKTITGRPYQENAIKAICNAFTNNRRKSLIVLATGTGKTRVSISLTDILMKANWVKNVLFLADRTSLVKQAHKNFTKLLPSVSTSVFAGDSVEKDSKARIIFSTYQSMINLIEGENKAFGIGRFDLIIIDEAHRSIFRKFKSIFNYFDALMVGLTATPRDEQAKSTYREFDLPKDEPDYEYDLVEAVKDKYLNSFALLDKTTALLKRNAKYSELPQSEKDRLESEYGDDNDVLKKAKETDEVKISRKTINVPTIRVMLNDLMQNGIKVDANDKIGKTIIFAKSHVEAEVIVEVFNSLYPTLGDDFCQLIDSHIDNAQQLIDWFELRNHLPQVVVSVDMLDTGIDVPDILNLVFFKPVYSKIKFLQMIGRGTRLSPDIFGKGKDKVGFFIFDYYDNFAYFEEKGSGQSFPQTSPSVSVAINIRRLNILKRLEDAGESKTTAFEKQFLIETKDYFVSNTLSLCNDDVQVEYNMSYVSKYRTDGIWDSISSRKYGEMVEHILPLFPPLAGNPKVKSFDLAMYGLADEMGKDRDEGKTLSVSQNRLTKLVNNIDKRLDELSKLTSIPQITEKSKEIEAMRLCNAIFTGSYSLEKIEHYRKSLRDLMPFLSDDADYIVTNIVDYIEKAGTSGGAVEPVKTYKEKVDEYLSDTSKPILAKIRNLDELTKDEQEELKQLFTVSFGSDGDFKSLSGGMALLPYIRKQIGIDPAAINTKFGSFYNTTVMNTTQFAICKAIIDYAIQNGDIAFKTLMSVKPFSDHNFSKVFGSKIVHVKALVNGLHNPVVEK